ncbi:hypothetical protein AVEN_54521-1 [Araneus ventricosus]|uniref:Uncharacterized protein n=1 Tax=Araneus ventricosus TaxID=182803 RepID=A0A4Y2EL64_ARAVE|nr:hypothetical protein AVEN_54521-1 [Araneus ventricosus]
MDDFRLSVGRPLYSVDNIVQFLDPDDRLTYNSHSSSPLLGLQSPPVKRRIQSSLYSPYDPPSRLIQCTGCLETLLRCLISYHTPERISDSDHQSGGMLRFVSDGRSTELPNFPEHPEGHSSEGNMSRFTSTANFGRLSWFRLLVLVQFYKIASVAVSKLDSKPSRCGR